jgi:hypothetical protein
MITLQRRIYIPTSSNLLWLTFGCGKVESFKKKINVILKDQRNQQAQKYEKYRVPLSLSLYPIPLYEIYILNITMDMALILPPEFIIYSYLCLFRFFMIGWLCWGCCAICYFLLPYSCSLKVTV